MSVSAPRFIYLASQSPRRRQLLEQVGVPHELLLADPGEDTESIEAVAPGEDPTAYVCRVTGLKLQAALARLRARDLPPAPVLCSDTTVALGQRIFGKPADAQEAVSMLRELAGATHRVLTAIAIAHDGRQHQAVSESRVTFEPLTTAQIERYVASGEPLGKAGAYAIQGRMALHVSHISGSYSGIMGLPLFETGQLLRAVGWPC
ncbi:septum formation inhibitor Maf [Ramlibacter sp. AW1]|uniref:dTTP/UTP pyrophosphatase n=1 Tax=Ramlibacter aurantiacus TaxID=2801330 RepID=A0A936ZFG7_9BURK|nr:Maf family protein [Ramlibacter aurantiacus]MBL0418922.1 septum formation inhibitor Maf [Ramlibacter aurantiacus]